MISDVATEIWLHSKSREDHEDVIVRPDGNGRARAMDECCSKSIDEGWKVQVTELGLWSRKRRFFRSCSRKIDSAREKGRHTMISFNSSAGRSRSLNSCQKG